MSWSKEQIQKVWEKGKKEPPNDSSLFRKDLCGAWIRRNEYGNKHSIWCWNINKLDLEKGKDISNLMPLHCKNNFNEIFQKLDCIVTSQKDKNIKKSTTYI